MDSNKKEQEDDLEHNHNSQQQEENPTTMNDRAAERRILILLLVYITLFASMMIIPRLLAENVNDLSGFLDVYYLLLSLFGGQVVVALISLFITCRQQKQISTVSKWMGYLPFVGVCTLVAFVVIKYYV
mmetsp:Transcript_10768/g.16520  ORF Transcript_10768/g.16520 Transcript_10768/m.16520 type:complete len:129 (-) Transcript_10768:24-410(-)